MTVEHGIGTAYPIVMGRQLMHSEAVSTGQALESSAAAPERTEEEPDDYEVPEATAPPPSNPPDTAPDLDFYQQLEELEHGSAYEGAGEEDSAEQEFNGDATAARATDPTLPLRAAALDRLTSLRVGLSESQPAVFNSLKIASPRGAGDSAQTTLRPGFYRPFVPWNWVDLEVLAKKPDLPTNTSDPAANKRNATANTRKRKAAAVVKRWNDWFALYTSPANPRKMPVDLVIAPDVTNPGSSAPSAGLYRRNVNAFLARFAGPIRLDNLMPWNEPNFQRTTKNDPDDPEAGPPRSLNPVVDNPRRAASYWAEANSLCARHCRTRFGKAVAGDFAGFLNPVKKPKFGKRTYEELYRSWIINNVKKTKRPRVWGFHAYEDVYDYLTLKTKARFLARISSRFHREVTGIDGYEYAIRSNGGQAQARKPALWLTEVGVPYRLPCSRLRDEARRGLCTPEGRPNQLFGMALQRDALAFLVRRLSTDTHKSIKRIYYYALHDVATREGAKGRCTTATMCRPFEWGLIGADDDNQFAAAPTTDRRHAREPAVSTPGHPRRSFCVLRELSLMPTFSAEGREKRVRKFNKPGRRFGTCPASSDAGVKP